MSRLIIGLFLLLLISALTGTASAQPPVDTLWLYDNNRSVSDLFADIYHCANGDFLLCGQSSYRPWVLRVDSEGAVRWSYITEGVRFFSVIEADNGDAVAVGRMDAGGNAVRLSRDGGLVWSRGYGMSRANGIIELKEGDFVISGSRGTMAESDGQLVRIQGNGDPVWNRSYRGGGNYDNFQGLRETEAGIAVVGSTDNPATGWLQKVNFDGDPIWSRTYQGFRNNGVMLWEMVSTAEGFALAGTGPGPEGGSTVLMFVAADGGLVHTEFFGANQGGGWCECLAKCSDGGIVLVGYDSNRLEHPFAIRTDRTGHRLWTTRLEEYVDNQPLRQPDHQYNQFYGVIVLPGDTIVACGTLCNTAGDRSDGDGLVVMLAPDRLVPEVWHKSPGDSLFEVLRGSEVQFTIHARDRYDRDLTKVWIRADSMVAGNVDSVTLDFPEIEIVPVTCTLELPEGRFNSGWSVTVSDFFISSYLPVSQNLAVRRNHPIDFRLFVSTNFEEAVRYNWIVTDVSNGEAEVVSETDSATFRFAHPGSYLMHGYASQNGLEDEVAWNIQASSVLWDYYPNELRLETYRDSSLTFNTTPSNLESDSLSFLWTLDGDTAGIDSRAVVAFPMVGEHSIVLVAQDGSDADTVRWEVTVREPNQVGKWSSGQVEKWGMLSVSPNPFNSTTTIRYSTSGDAYPTRLTVHDLTGREVRECLNAKMNAGEYSTVLNGADFPAGIYFLRLETGKTVQVQKLALVR